jgi:hypothetical protein
MANQRGQILRRDFTKGLVTEASDLAFPENASTDELNFDITNKSTRRRRKGFDLESGHVVSVLSNTPSELEEAYLASGRWVSPGGEGNLEFASWQVGNKLYFFNTTVQPVAVQTMTDTRTSTSTPIDMDDFKSIGSAGLLSAGNPVTTATGNGFLFVAGEDIDPFYVKYDPETNEITSTKITIKVRDIEGVDDGLEDDERPTTLSDEHHYNLFNQGWFLEKVIEVDGTGTDVKFDSEFLLPVVFEKNGKYPSNNDIWWTRKRDGAFEAGFTHGDTLAGKGTSRAPRGHFIIDAFHRDRAFTYLETSGWFETTPTTITLDPESFGPSRPSTIGFFAGRVWYAGQQGKLHSTIFFSQVLESETEIPKCYQKNDPTDEDNSQVIATDGGTIKIPEVAKVVKLQPFGEWLLVMASNGIWAIGGGTESGFTAEAFRVKKVASVNCISPFSTIDARGNTIFWSDSGIYLITASEVDESPILQNISEPSIQSFYEDNIPPLSRLHATGAYDPLNNRVVWLYRSTLPSAGETNFEYDQLLILDLKRAAFLPWSLYAGTLVQDPYIAGIISLPAVGSFNDSEVVTDGGFTVTDSSVDVTVNILSLSTSDSTIKYLIKKNPLFRNVPASLSLSNWDFEEGSLTGWTTDNGWAVSSGAGPFFASAIPKPASWDTYFANVFDGANPGASTTATLSRTMDISSLPSDVLDAIDDGTYEFEVGWESISYNPGPPFDQHGATITFKTSGGTTITTLSLTDQNYPSTVSGQEPDVNTLGPTAAVGCRSIDIEVRVLNDTQVGINYILDNFFVTIKDPDVDEGEVSTDLEVTFGDFRREDVYSDWLSTHTSGKEYSSYLETGHEYVEEPSSLKTVPYLYSFVKKETGAAGTVQGKWDFADAVDSSKFTKKHNIARDLRDDRSTIVNRTKIRGRGRALKLRFEAETDKPLELLGWAIEVNKGDQS